MTALDLATIRTRIATLESQLDRALADGADSDSYNVGWLEGAIHELRKLVAA